MALLKVSPDSGLNRSGVRATKDDVEGVSQGKAGLRRVPIEGSDKPVAGGGVGDGFEDGVEWDERVSGEVHLRNEARGEGRAEHGEVDMRWPPGVGVVSPGVGAGMDGDEAVVSAGIGEAAPSAGEVRIQRRIV